MMKSPYLLFVCAGLASAGCGASSLNGDEDITKNEARDYEPAAGMPVPEWQFEEWHGGPPRKLADLRGRVVVVRFWTDQCPYCAESLPALEELAKEFADEPVTFVGAYHSKPLGSERPWKTAIQAAEQMKVSFPIAYDRKWKTVLSWWSDHRPRSPTSATFVIGPAGKIVHVHPGPEFHPGDDPKHAKCHQAFADIRRAIRQALPERD